MSNSSHSLWSSHRLPQLTNSALSRIRLIIKLVEENLEKAKARDRSLAFLDLVLQILDLDIREKVATSDPIAMGLNNRGWDVAGVSSIWQVSPSIEYEASWNDTALERLGGKGMASRVWLSLKNKNLTGFSKKAGTTMESFGNKKRKMKEDYEVGNCSKVLAPIENAPVYGNGLTTPPSSPIVYQKIADSDVFQHS